MSSPEPRIAFVVAVSRHGVIGRDGGLPWRIPSDLKRFKAITMGKPIIMGRKTWEGLPRKPLPGRENIVVTRESSYSAPGAYVVPNVGAAIEKAKSFSPKEIHVIGGGELFRAMFHLADRLYLTEVDLEVDGDTFFPKIEPKNWSLVTQEEHLRGPNDSASTKLLVLDRIKPETGMWP